MLAVWCEGALQIGVSCGFLFNRGKLGLVQLSGVDSTVREETPAFAEMKNCRKIKLKDYFCYPGLIDGQDYVFKIDTGSDVSILNKRFVVALVQGGSLNSFQLRYPTGEKVPIISKKEVKIVLGDHSLEFPVFIAEIEDDCILGVDFLSRLNLEGVFDSNFCSSKSKKLQGKKLN
jgi:hypothetical protein